MKGMLRLLCAFVLAASLSACRPAPQPQSAGQSPAELTFAIENDLTNLDPIKSQEPYSLQVIGQVFEGLVSLDDKNEVVPALAETWTHNADYSVWRFNLRKGVMFHEDDSLGPQRTREVTADDVLYSFQRVVSKDSYPSFVLADAVQGVAEFQAGKTDKVSGMRVPEPGVFEVQLQKPEPSFLNRITSPWFCVYPKETASLGADVFGRSKAVGTGPYRLVQRGDTEVILERNQRYWRPVGGNVSRLVFKVIRNDQIRVAELRNGNISVMRLPLTVMPGILSGGGAARGGYALQSPFDRDFAVGEFPTFNTHFIGFNCDRMDVHLRRAISLAINRSEILQVITHGSGVLSTGTVSIGLLGYAPPYPDDIFNLEQARAELKQSRFDAAGSTIELLVHEKNNTEQLGQLVQEQLKQVGLNIRIQKLDYNAVVGRMIKGDTQAFALAFEYVFSAPEPMLNNIFASEKIPVPNFWHYRNPAVDADLARLRTVGDRAQANAISQGIEKQIVDDAPAAFLYQLKNLVIFRKNVSGVSFNGHSIPLLWEARVGG